MFRIQTLETSFNYYFRYLSISSSLRSKFFFISFLIRWLSKSRLRKVQIKLFITASLLFTNL